MGKAPATVLEGDSTDSEAAANGLSGGGFAAAEI
jgi:hypothetical protein